MESIETKIKNNGSIHRIEYSKYVAPVIKPSISKDYTLNGDNNSFFKYIKDCYNGSPTNAAIINAFTNYIFGEGLIDNKEGEKANILKYVSRRDLKLMVLDYKTYGSFSYQVIWNLVDTLADKKPVRIKYVSVINLGLNINNLNQVDGYWYCFDWEQISLYKPTFYPKFDGEYKYKNDEKTEGHNVEIVIVNRTSSEPFFPNPDYLPALQAAEMEMELSNAGINHIKNGFSATKIVNVPFKPESEELEDEYAANIKNKTTGSQNQGEVIIAFNENPDYKVTVEAIEVTELNAQYQHFEEVAEKKIIIGHSAPPILFSGSRDGGGLGNNSEEIKTATEMLYRKHINPMREDIIEGLEVFFTQVDSTIELGFKDFEEFKVENQIQTVE